MALTPPTLPPSCKAPPPSRTVGSKDGISSECRTNLSQDPKIFAIDLILGNFWKENAKVKHNDKESKRFQMKLLSSKSMVIRESTASEEPLGFLFCLFEKSGPNSNGLNESKSNLKRNPGSKSAFLATLARQLATAHNLCAVGAGSCPGRPPGRPLGQFPGRSKPSRASKNKEFCFV